MFFNLQPISWSLGFDKSIQCYDTQQVQLDQENPLFSTTNKQDTCRETAMFFLLFICSKTLNEEKVFVQFFPPLSTSGSQKTNHKESFQTFHFKHNFGKINTKFLSFTKSGKLWKTVLQISFSSQLLTQSKPTDVFLYRPHVEHKRKC